MNFFKNNRNFALLVVLILVVFIVLWKRPVPVSAPGITEQSPAPLVTASPLPIKTPPSSTPIPAAKPSTSSTNGAQYYTPRGTQIVLPLYYGTDPKDVIRVASPKQKTTVSSPINVSGEARGSWYFEGSFPVVLIDAKGKVLARGIAKAQTNWMTSDFVTFKATLSFVRQPLGSTGRVILQKDNPSGLPQNDAYAEVPVTFE